jgi:hypothetical protein
MLKYFALFLISLSCFASEPKFHYMDCVKVVQGFYRGCKGKVTDYMGGNNSEAPSYVVDFDDCKGHPLTQDFYENELEACKK